jgi:hypothetical protein
LARENITHIDWLRKEPVETEDDLLKELLHYTMQMLTNAEVDGICGAEYRERSEERVNRRNGYRPPKAFDTRVRGHPILAVAGHPDSRNSERSLTARYSQRYLRVQSQPREVSFGQAPYGGCYGGEHNARARETARIAYLRVGSQMDLYVDRRSSTGSTSFTYDNSEYGGGVYFLVLEAGGGTPARMWLTALAIRFLFELRTNST